MSEMEARKYIAELIKIVGTSSVLVVMPLGGVKRLYCPFWVICKVGSTTSGEKERIPGGSC